MDIKTSFFSGNIEETIYMVQPENSVLDNVKCIVCKLKKSIYGIKKYSRQYYQKFYKVIISFGFEVNLVYDYVYQNKYSARSIPIFSYLLYRSDITIFMRGRHKSISWE